MTETMFRTALGEKILKHWREHCPQMVRDLEQQNRLDQAVFEAQHHTGKYGDASPSPPFWSADSRPLKLIV